MKKKICLIISILFLLCFFQISLATDEIEIAPTSEEMDISESSDAISGEDTILIDNEEDYNDLLANTDSQSTKSQSELEESFKNQQSEIAQWTSGEKDEKFVITKVYSDIKSEYSEDSYYGYYFLIKYQTVAIRTSDGTETNAVAVLAYDVFDHKNIKPLKAGDTVYGYIDHAEKGTENYYMVHHDLTDDNIAYISVTNQDRTLGIILFTIFTILLLVLYAGKNGAKALIPLFVIFDLLFIVFIPELEVGKSVLLLASLISLELIILISVLKNGWSKKALVAITSSIIVVAIIVVLAVLFGNANSLTGKGILPEENYYMLQNRYYIDSLFKSTIGSYDVYLAIIILIASVISASIASRVTELSEKYAGTEGMINNIIEEAKSIVGDYPIIIATIITALYLPTYMIAYYNHPAFENIINAESLVTYLSIGLVAVISSLIISPITAIISYLFMGKVEIKQISE